jgi:excisionase family DNA binding protein
MPHHVFNIEEVAEYLHLTAADVNRRVKEREIPFEQRGERVIFRKRDIDQWASQRILGLSQDRLVEYHQKSTREAGIVRPRPRLPPFASWWIWRTKRGR